MARIDHTVEPVSCYFCGGEIWFLMGSNDAEREKIRTNEGELVLGWVCEDCHPRK